MMEWVVVHEARVVPGVQNGLAQVAGKPMPAPGWAVVRAVLLTGNAVWMAMPGDKIEHRAGPFTTDIIGQAEVLGVLRVVAKDLRMPIMALTVDGHEPEPLELEELAEGLGFADTWALTRRLEELAEMCGGETVEACVVCW